MKLENLKVIFFGTSKFASIILNQLISNSKVVLVVTQPDMPIGRKQILTTPPVKQYLIDNNINIPIEQFESLKEENVVNILKEYDADIFIVASYGKIIPSAILNLPIFKCINIHGSVLPKYRGASPIQQTLLNGDATTGNTIMLMDEQMDHGAILAQSEVKIAPDDDFSTLTASLAVDGAQLLVDTLEKYINNKISSQPQDESKSTYTKIITKQDGIVDFDKMSATEIYNKCRAYYEWPGISTTINCVDVKLNKIRIAKDENNGDFVIKAKEGFIEILEITPNGKKKMSGKSFTNGYANKDCKI